MRKPLAERVRRAGLAGGVLVCLAVADGVEAQDTLPRPPADTAAADTLEDALARELERLRRDSAAVPLPDYPRPVPGVLGGGQASLNPDISAIGELLADLSPEEPRFVEGGDRFAVREVELGIQAVVDPYFRADFFVGVHPEEVEIEEAYLTALALPGGLQAKLGRFLVPFGKVNLTHRPELITVDYPLVIQEYFGEEGFASAGVGASKILAPLGFFQELQLFVLSGIEREEHAHGEEEEHEETPAVVSEEDRGLGEELALLGHLRNYWDLSAAANVELGVSAAYGSVEHLREVEPGFFCGPEDDEPCPEGLARTFEPQAFWGADLTIRWRPPSRAIYRSFVWNTEVVANDGPDGVAVGAFTQAQWQLARRWYLGGRFDAVERVEAEDVHAGEEHEHGEDEHGEDEHGEEEHGGEWLYAGSGYLTFFPSEFSRLKLGVQRRFGPGAEEEGRWRAVLQTTFAIGPHRPHAF